MKTADPICDMERSQKDSRPIIGYCEYCGNPIHGETDTHEADYAYDDGRVMFCENCVSEYLKQYKI